MSNSAVTSTVKLRHEPCNQ